jgi:hypothetical protein
VGQGRHADGRMRCACRALRRRRAAPSLHPGVSAVRPPIAD